MAAARTELEAVLGEDALREAVLLVMANKQDAPNAASVKDIAAALGLSKERSHRWHVQATAAVLGDGLYEGLDWMATAIKDGRKEAAAAGRS